MTAVDLALQFRTVTCCNSKCGTTFAMISSLYDKRRRDHNWFYCPLGHRQYFAGQSDVERVQTELNAERERRGQIERQRDRAVEKARREQLSKRAHKGHLTRIKNRIANGVCPCCNRSFANVRRHMANKHPDYKIPA